MAVSKLKKLPTKGKSVKRTTKLWSKDKVLRVCASFGLDPEDVTQRYESSGRMTVPSEEATDAVRQWFKTHDWNALMSALGTTNRSTAQGAITRAISTGMVSLAEE